MSLLERLGIAVPVIGAGMGGGLSAAALTIAIGRAGGMGQIGMASPAEMRTQMAAHREAADAGPLVVNLLLPFAGRAHWMVASDAEAVVTFWGGRGAQLSACGSISAGLSRKPKPPLPLAPTESLPRASRRADT